MKAVSLFAVLVLAKILELWGHHLAWSGWAPLVYVWQDLLVALLFAAVDGACRRTPRVGWGLYGAVVVYVAVNVPVACVLSTPLTWPLWRAAGGTLAGSIRHHITRLNLLRLGGLLLAAAALPVVLRHRLPRLSAQRRAAVLATGAALVLLGAWVTPGYETLGLHRNALVALVSTALPRVAEADVTGDWRASPFGDAAEEDLSGFRGLAAGRNVVIVHLESTGAGYLLPLTPDPSPPGGQGGRMPPLSLGGRGVGGEGAGLDPMPFFTRLCRRGWLYENAYTAYPETIKSFFAVECATCPALDTDADDYGRFTGPALATVLAEAGYRTACFHSGRFMYLGMDRVVRGRGFQTLEDAGDIGGERESSFGIDEHSTVRRLLSWIDGLPAGRPFFVTYLPVAGHHPYDTPEGGPFAQDAEVNRYRNALRYADTALGELWQGLRERGLTTRTVLVILGDHGEAFGQHEGNYGHTLFIYDENVRVPFLVVAPDLTDLPRRFRRVVSLIDTAPTVLDLLGLSVPAGLQGQSLLEPRGRMALFCTDYSLGLVGLRDGRWKMIHELDSGRSQLFDVDADPGERVNLAERFPERVAVYRARLLTWCAAQKHRVRRAD